LSNDICIANVEPIGKVRLHEALFEDRLCDSPVMFKNPVQRTVSQNGVSPQRDIHLELNIVGGCDIGDMVQNLFGSLTPSKLLGIAVNYWSWLPNWG
jgi:hypothetical protein